jgi:hypothetical protein
MNNNIIKKNQIDTMIKNAINESYQIPDVQQNDDNIWLTQKNHKELYDLVPFFQKTDSGIIIVNKNSKYNNKPLSTILTNLNLKDEDAKHAIAIYNRNKQKSKKNLNQNIYLANLLAWVGSDLLIHIPNNQVDLYNKWNNKSFEDLEDEYGSYKLLNALNDTETKKYVKFPQKITIEPTTNLPIKLGQSHPIVGKVQQKLGIKPNNNLWIKTHLNLSDKFSRYYSLDSGITEQLLKILNIK